MKPQDNKNIENYRLRTLSFAIKPTHLTNNMFIKTATIAQEVCLPEIVENTRSVQRLIVYFKSH